MAQVIREEDPRDTVVVERDGRSNLGTIVVAVVVILLLLWLLGGRIF